jgi:prepilin-type N-terminal cleavage/methylation domain-containing protein
LIKRLKDQGGYSLPEVMVAILLLSLAIIPMVSMFDAGLRAAVVGSNYDQARAIAGEEQEEIQALPFRVDPNPPKDSVVEIYPPGTTTPCTGPILAGFGCQVKTTYVSVGPSSVNDDPNARTMLKVEVTVTWDGGNKSYTTTGLVSKETRCAIEAEC